MMDNVLNMRFWGTGFGGGTPEPFCNCRVCEYARQYGGKDMRTRSSFRIDGKVMIDIGCDFVTQAMKYRESMINIEHVLYTHTHSDHFDTQLFLLKWVACNESENSKPINMYFSNEAIRNMDSLLKGNEQYLDGGLFRLHALDYEKTYNIGGYEVTPLRGRHSTEIEKMSINYLIGLPNGKKFYYALDSGYYYEETFEYLKNVKLDALISECTILLSESQCYDHQNLTSAKQTFDRLYEQGTIDSDTRIYLSHIGDKTYTHDELSEYWKNKCKNYSVSVAYDGLSIADVLGM